VVQIWRGLRCEASWCFPACEEVIIHDGMTEIVHKRTETVRERTRIVSDITEIVHKRTEIVRERKTIVGDISQMMNQITEIVSDFTEIAVERTVERRIEGMLKSNMIL
jgi:hypothetical protein